MHIAARIEHDRNSSFRPRYARDDFPGDQADSSCSLSAQGITAILGTKEAGANELTVGLFGEDTKTAVVESVTASIMASTAFAPSSRKGTGRGCEPL